MDPLQVSCPHCGQRWSTETMQCCNVKPRQQVSLRVAWKRRRDGAWPGNLLASHSSYADRHTTWRTRTVGRRARIQRINSGTRHPGRPRKYRVRGENVEGTSGSLEGASRAWIQRTNWLRTVECVCVSQIVPLSSAITQVYPPTPLTLSVPGVWRRGPGSKRRGIPARLWLFAPRHLPRASSGVAVSFPCFCCAEPESHLLQCRRSSVLPRAVAPRAVAPRPAPRPPRRGREPRAVQALGCCLGVVSLLVRAGTFHK